MRRGWGLGVVMLAMLSGLAPARAADVTLRVPTLPDGLHVYYHALLRQALEGIGARANLVTAEPLPPSRIVKELIDGTLSLFWMEESSARQQRFLAIEGGLTNGLVGQRVLLIRPGSEPRFAGIAGLADLRSQGLVGGLSGAGFDIAVWQANDLAFRTEEGGWQGLYGLLATAGRGIDYVPRGAHEALAEAAAHPELAVEPRLVLAYDRDLRFYLSPRHGDQKAVLDKAMRAALAGGLINKLLREHFPAVYGRLQLDRRIRIDLLTPR